MTEDELRAVAQAITDAHGHKPGLDSDGRMGDAKTFIAAFDAIMKHRAPVYATSAAACASIQAGELVEPNDPNIGEITGDNVTPIKTKKAKK